HMRGDAHGDLWRSRVDILFLTNALADLTCSFSDLHDLANVTLLFRGQADHEVKLHALPPTREDALGGCHQLLFSDVLVHNITHALAAGFSRKRHATRTNLSHVIEHAFLEPIRTKRRDAERHFLGREAIGDLLNERRDARIIRRRE